ncbi:MAG: hypothetical protein PHN88_06070 [Ignavibacteria bacterium]|nr:hypothetical protein [Ignavibacteria bacterium]
MKKLIILITFLLIAKLNFAQVEFHPGSPYSAFGIGELKYSASMRTDNMGIQGISLFGNYVNNLNPAANTYLKNTYISLGTKVLMMNSSNASSTIKVSDTYISGFNLGIPFWNKYGMALSFGFSPYSQVEYKISGYVNDPVGPYTATFAGNGGLSKLNFGLAGRPLPFLNLGFDYNYAFGNINELTYLDFGNSSYTNTYLRTENNLKGNYFKAGTVIDLGAMFPKNKVFDKLNLGAFYQNKFSLSSELDKIYGTSMVYNDTEKVVNGNLDIPESYGFGITKQFGKQLILSSDILFQKWSKFTNPESPANYADNFRYGIGFEVLPAPKIDKTAWESLTYRFGFSYDKSYYKINGEYVNGYALNFGIGIPINNENAADLGFEIGTRGKTDNGLVKDKYIKVSLGLNFGEFWFIRQKEEDK